MRTNKNTLLLIMDDHEAKILSIQLANVVKRQAVKHNNDISHIVDLHRTIRDYLRDNSE